MAKILVADDNSNVQKTVALALAELGVEIVSVNNGEAAVRKLGDFSPDLVLADIFMPVRNGYEVCEYVKKDSRFSRVPVVLLVGAFDPFDEREAQRVGADGILKKPFVPPDPLIAMVKTLLDRVLGERLVAVSASKPSAAVQAQASGTAIAEMPFPEPEVSEDSSQQEFPAPAGRIEFGDGARPVAFGTLLETPVQDTVPSNTGVIDLVDDEQVITSARDATLGDPIFWRSDSPEPEPEIEPSSEAPAELEMRSWKQEEDSPSHVDEAAPLQPVEPLELVRDEQDETSPSVVDSNSILQDPASWATLNVASEKEPDLAANPIEWMATAPSVRSEEPSTSTPQLDQSVPDGNDAIDIKTESSEHPEAPAQIPVQILKEASTPLLAESSVTPNIVPPLAPPADPIVEDEASVTPTPVAAVVEPPKTQPEPSAEDTARSIPRKDWADLTETLQASASELLTQQMKSAAPPADPIVEDKAPVTPTPVVAVVEPPKTQPEPSAEDTARSIPRKDWADLTETLQASASELLSQQMKSAAERTEQAPVVPTGSSQVAPVGTKAAHDSPSDAALVEAVVQRVLEKMRPQVVDMVTKEFLRPIVQALVSKEIEKL